jgi:redox-sensitive bicupin YhaK (pirin superfamily)
VPRQYLKERRVKRILGVYSAPRGNWVGDGFPVRTLLHYRSQDRALSPFLLLDYAGPVHFEPANHRRGVGEHPHRGFETVTIVYQGEVAHRDSTGAGGLIGPGDVQWMTAASGIVHEEFHSDAFTRQGGVLEMVQLWVNLPARHKMSPPGYQALTAASIPAVELPDGAGRVRVIAGEYGGHHGPARTRTPIDLWDLRLRAGAALKLELVAGRAAAVVVLQGTVLVNGSQLLRDAEWLHLGSEGNAVTVKSDHDAQLLVLAGEPIDEPIVGHGPFVMNTAAELEQAISDFRTGRFGRMSQTQYAVTD